jgi:putative transcriptional regulator
MTVMSIVSIRKGLGLSQAQFAAGIGVTQGNVSHYECGRQQIPPDVAARIIAFAKTLDFAITFDDIYAPSAEKAA